MHSRTWVMEPADEDSSESVMVWMESMMTMSGFFAFTCSVMTSTSVSQSTSRLSEVTPRRSARSLIWWGLSSPEA